MSGHIIAYACCVMAIASNGWAAVALCSEGRFGQAAISIALIAWFALLAWRATERAHEAAILRTFDEWSKP